MTKKFIFVFLAQVIAVISLYSMARADNSLDIKIVPYYQNSALLTDRLLPFSVTDDLDQPKKIISITEQPNCSFMIDVYRTNVFHAYCTSPTILKIEITVEDKGQFRRITLPDLIIRQLSVYKNGGAQ